MSSVDKSSSSQSPLSGQVIVYAGITWAVLALLFYLLFSITAPGEEQPFWYSIGTYVFEEVAFLGAALMCFRNWRSPQIASGRNVWLGIGIGMTSYFIGNLLLAWWELVWGLDPDVSPADFFFVTMYVSVTWGMILAVLPRRLNLETKQWLVVAAIAIVGIAFAIGLYLIPGANSAEAPALPSPVAQVAPKAKVANAVKKAPLVKGKSAPTVAAIKPVVAATPAPTAEAPEKVVPGWVSSLEDILAPLAEPLGYLYVIGDVLLLVISATLLLAFWGGRFAQSWRMIAAAALSYYIADMWFNYATDHIADYQSGFLLEVFWVFSGVLFAIGAALEYDTSSRSRRGGRKRA